MTRNNRKEREKKSTKEILKRQCGKEKVLREEELENWKERMW